VWLANLNSNGKSVLSLLLFGPGPFHRSEGQPVVPDTLETAAKLNNKGNCYFFLSFMEKGSSSCLKVPIFGLKSNDEWRVAMSSLAQR
jgi:hypothetical protein